MANRIQGKYTIYAPLPATYKFTGNDRDAEFDAGNQNIVLSAKCLNIFGGTGTAKFRYNAAIKIRRARLVSRGAEEVAPPLDPDKYCGDFVLGIVQYLDGSGKDLDTVRLKFTRWNEWTDLNAVLRPYATKADTWEGASLSTLKPVSFELKYQNALFCVDDYNIQDAYIDQDMNTALEMQIETAGIIDSYSGRIL